MQREDLSRIRRELGLDLVEAGRKAGVTASTPEPERMKSVAECEAGDPLGLYLKNLEKFDASCDAS